MRVIWPMEFCEMWNKSKIILGCAEKNETEILVYVVAFNQFSATGHIKEKHAVPICDVIAYIVFIKVILSISDTACVVRENDARNQFNFVIILLLWCISFSCFTRISKRHILSLAAPLTYDNKNYPMRICPGLHVWSRYPYHQGSVYVFPLTGIHSMNMHIFHHPGSTCYVQSFHKTII